MVAQLSFGHQGQLQQFNGSDRDVQGQRNQRVLEKTLTPTPSGGSSHSQSKQTRTVEKAAMLTETEIEEDTRARTKEGATGVCCTVAGEAWNENPKP